MTDPQKKVLLTTTVRTDQLRRLADLARETQVPRAAIIRNAIDLYLATIDAQRAAKKASDST
jgi:predicted transcriptional regulator